MTQETLAPTALKIAHTADQLFRKYGISRVTVEEICDTVGISRMTFYRYFSSKNELGKHFLYQMHLEMMAKMRNLMEHSETFDQFVSGVLRLKMEQQDEVSDEFMRTYLEEPELLEYVHTLMTPAGELLEEYLEKCLQRGDIRPNVNLKLVRFMLQHAPYLLRHKEFLALFEGRRSMVRDLIEMFFYGFAPQPDSGEKES